MGGYQLLSPRLKYTYSPFEDQNDIPNFNTRIASINYQQLFSDSWFLGYDRLQDLHAITPGINYRYIDATGVTRFDGSIAEQFYYDDGRVTLEDQTPVFDTDSSGMVWNISTQPYNNVWVDVSGALNSSYDLNYITTELRYQPSSNSLFNVGFVKRQEDENTNQLPISALTASAIFPINNNWRVLAQGQYDYRRNQTLDALVGIDYEDCCIGFAVYGRRYYNDLNINDKPNQAIMAEIRLNGLGSDSGRLTRLLADKVLGFEPTQTALERLANDLPYRYLKLAFCLPVHAADQPITDMTTSIRIIMRLFSLRQTNRAILASMSASPGLVLAFNAQAATVEPTNSQNASAQSENTNRLTSATSTDGIIALVNDNAILKSDLINAIMQTRARAQAAGQPIANSPQLQSEVLNGLIQRELQLSLANRLGLQPDDAAINQRLAQIAQAEGVNSLAGLQQKLDANQPGRYAALRAKLFEDAAIQALQQRQVSSRVRISEQDVDAFLASPEAKRLNQNEYQTIHVRVPYIDDYSRLSAAQREQALAVAKTLRTRLLESNVDVEAAMSAAQGSYPIPLQGGDMGFHSAAALPTELSSQITKLDVGEVSAPLVTPEGIDIVKLADKTVNNKMIVPQWDVRHILVKIDELQTDSPSPAKNQRSV